MKKSITLLLLILGSINVWGQSKDSLKTKVLRTVTIQGQKLLNNLEPLPDLEETYNYIGKKSEVLNIAKMDVSVSEKVGRQIFAKVPGIFVYDMEGSNQINISTRGLDTHRAWEFNVRKDGIMVNSDIYAYPGTHYSILMESVEKVEIVRGTGSLQYGAQFGGRMNYVTKQGDTTKPIHFESFNTAGSYNLLSTYNAVGGTINKFQYYAYFSKRNKDGYRENEHTDYHAGGIKLSYHANENLLLRLEWAKSNYTYKIPGPLNDFQFAQNPRQSTRFRNYYNPNITIPSFTLKWKINENTKLQYIASAVEGTRNSAIFNQPATIPDLIDPNTLEYANRQINIDRFNSITNEIRIQHNYSIGKNPSTLIAGAQLMNNDLHRTQNGVGTTGIDYDLSLIKPYWGKDMHFKTNNLALFLENNLKLSENFSWNIGARLEEGQSKMTGFVDYLPDNQATPVLMNHKFPLFGTSFSFKTKEKNEIYAGFSQAYRPNVFKDIVPANSYEKVDPNLKDAYGYNAEIGFRGSTSYLKWDITGFLLNYQNRFGIISLLDENNQYYGYRTNVGNSLNKGLEIYLEGTWALNNKAQISLFTSSSIMDGRYTSGEIKVGEQNKSIKGNKIESVPTVISRNGISLQYEKLSSTLLFSYTGKNYADALNTEIPNEAGTVGIVPAYTVIDLNLTYRYSENIQIRGAINNLLNKQYFSKRPAFYPGPGIWPSDGINGNISLVLSF